MTAADSSTNIFVSASVKQGADIFFFFANILQMGGFCLVVEFNQDVLATNRATKLSFDKICLVLFQIKLITLKYE